MKSAVEIKAKISSLEFKKEKYILAKQELEKWNNWPTHGADTSEENKKILEIEAQVSTLRWVLR